MKRFQNNWSIKFDLIDGYYIRKLDKYNWILAQSIKSKKWYERIHGYYPDLCFAWKGALNILTLSWESLNELRDIISRLEKLKASNKL